MPERCWGAAKTLFRRRRCDDGGRVIQQRAIRGQLAELQQPAEGFFRLRQQVLIAEYVKGLRAQLLLPQPLAHRGDPFHGRHVLVAIKAGDVALGLGQRRIAGHHLADQKAPLPAVDAPPVERAVPGFDAGAARPRGDRARRVPAVANQQDELRVRENRLRERHAEDHLGILVHDAPGAGEREIGAVQMARAPLDRRRRVLGFQAVRARAGIEVPVHVLAGAGDVPQQFGFVQHPDIAMKGQQLAQDRRPAPAGAQDENGPVRRSVERQAREQAQLRPQEEVEPTPAHGYLAAFEEQVAGDPVGGLARSQADVQRVQFGDHLTRLYTSSNAW